MAAASQTPKSLKAQITRTSLVLAAAALLREEGPKSVTYRKVAKLAGAASSSVGYYFDTLADLLHEAARYNMQLWADRAEKAASLAESLSPEECRDQIVDLLVSACLPDEGSPLSNHYAQLIAASVSDEVTKAYRRGHGALEGATARILNHAHINMPACIVGALIDGSAVIAISEGYDVRKYAAQTLENVLEKYQ